MSVTRRTLLAVAAAMFAALLMLPRGAEAQSTVDVKDLMVPGPLGERSIGSAEAPVTVVEYASLTCPHCQRFHAEVYPEFKKKYVDTGKVRFILREFPLDPVATTAVVAARCAPADEFFLIIDAMFDHQDDWAFRPGPVARLLKTIQNAGFSEFTDDYFLACVHRQDLLDGVNAVHDRAYRQFGINSTPTFFFNGRRQAGEISLAEIDAIIQPMLAAATEPAANKGNPN